MSSVSQALSFSSCPSTLVTPWLSLRQGVHSPQTQQGPELHTSLQQRLQERDLLAPMRARQNAHRRPPAQSAMTSGWSAAEAMVAHPTQA